VRPCPHLIGAGSGRPLPTAPRFPARRSCLSAVARDGSPAPSACAPAQPRNNPTRPQQQRTLLYAANARARRRDTALFEAGQLRERADAAEQRAAVLEASLSSERAQGAALRDAEREARAEREAAADVLREAAGEVAALHGERTKTKAAQAALREVEAAGDKIKARAPGGFGRRASASF
jgi:hypothetical protein